MHLVLPKCILTDCCCFDLYRLLAYYAEGRYPSNMAEKSAYDKNEVCGFDANYLWVN